MSNRATGIALAFLTAVISGVSIYVNSLAVKHFTDQTVYTTAKNGVAGLLLLLVLWVALRRRPSPRRRHTPPPRRMSALALLIVAVIGGSVPFVLFFEGLARAQATQAAFIQKTLVIWVAVLAVPLLRERFRFAHALSVALLIAGQAWIAGSAGRVVFGQGEAMILGATLLWAVEVVYVRWLLGQELFDSRVLAAARMGLGTVLLLVWLALTGKFQALTTLSTGQWRWVALTGVLLFGYVGSWYAALARAQAVDVTAVLVFGAVITALLAGTAGSSPISVPGVLLIVSGSALIAWTTLRTPAGVRRPANSPFINR
jgi:drug/metabolite transporter (DMT)-like permease